MRTIRMLRTVAIAGVFGAEVGSVVSADDEAAAGMVALGNAVYTDSPPPVLVYVAEPVPVSEIRSDIKKPAINDSKAQWVDYAMSHGMDEEAANLMTKADLMAKYSTR